MPVCRIGECRKNSHFRRLGNSFLCGRDGLAFRGEYFPVAAFLQAGAGGTGPGALLYDEGCGGVVSRYRNSHVRCRKLAFWVGGAAVENPRPPAPAFSRAAAANEFAVI